MTTFAHIEDGKALDPHVNVSATEYLRRYAIDTTAAWNVVEVPDGTLHGAIDNGDGTFTNPAPPIPIEISVVPSQIDVLTKQVQQLTTAIAAAVPAAAQAIQAAQLPPGP